MRSPTSLLVCTLLGAGPWIFTQIGCVIGLTFLVPVAFAVTVPASALTGRLTLQAWLGALALTVFFFIAARIIWRIGLKNYSGASA
jgi:ABC-type uncharacterized transport system permease subunit